jgi:hypothetical protein
MSGRRPRGRKASAPSWLPEERPRAPPSWLPEGRPRAPLARVPLPPSTADAARLANSTAPAASHTSSAGSQYGRLRGAVVFPTSRSCSGAADLQVMYLGCFRPPSGRWPLARGAACSFFVLAIITSVARRRYDVGVLRDAPCTSSNLHVYE